MSEAAAKGLGDGVILERPSTEDKAGSALRRLLKPRSIAIVGMSSRAGSAGRNVLENIKDRNFDGQIHIVGRGEGTLDGLPYLPSVDALPEGVDLAIFTLPGTAAEPALTACIERKVGGVVLFASGFAEIGGDEGRTIQDRLGSIALGGGLALLGPNCIGFVNNVDGVEISFLRTPPAATLRAQDAPAVAMLGQSGGMLGSLEMALTSRGLPISFRVSTGNEAALGVSELMAFLSTDPMTGVIAIYAEQIRNPSSFLGALGRARRAGKTVVLLHSGRTEGAKAAAKSHTGSLAGDYDVMRAHVEAEGGVVAANMDQFVDVTELALRFRTPPTEGVGILSGSGAFGALAVDSCDAAGLEVARLSTEALDALRGEMPSFVTPSNPLDLSTQVAFQPELMQFAARVLINEPTVGSMVYSTPPGAIVEPAILENLVAGVGDSPKMLTVALWGDAIPMAPEFEAVVRKHNLVVSRSADRSIAAIARLTEHGRSLKIPRREISTEPFPDLPALRSGPQPEWLGKQVLRAIGIPVPPGGLAKTAEEASRLAGEIGFPVALKAQASEITHKTEAGALSLGLNSEAEVQTAWRKLEGNVARHAPGVVLEGMLVERMASKGLDLMIGAKRDPDWGPLLLVGLGGVWVEVLNDTKLMTIDLTEAAMIERMGKLRGAKLLQGFRGSPPVDIQAVASCLSKLARLMATSPQIVEVDVNPLVALPKGDGVVALDALIISR